MKVVVCVFLMMVSFTFGLPNGLGLTPPMGYNTWYDLMCVYTADQVKEAAEQMVKLGLDKLGYTYVNLDDCWAAGRWSNGSVYADQKVFPRGIVDLSDFVHSLGLLFGIYTDRGTKTCANRPGSLTYEKIDALTYAQWGVDFVKEDSCYASQDHEVAFQQYGTMRDALNATRRKIFFSLCGWNSWYAPVGYSLGNSWRIAGDGNGWSNVINNINTNAALSQYAGPGGWNDPDILLGSKPNTAVYLTQDQSRSMFSTWTVMAAPLLIGASVRNISDYDLQTFSNAEAIAVNQDSLGKQGVRIVGGDLINTEITNPVVAIVAPCDQTKQQQWVWQDEEMLRNVHSGECLRVLNSKGRLGYASCPKSKTEQDSSFLFALKDNKLVSQIGRMDKCVSIMPDGVNIALYNCKEQELSQSERFLMSPQAFVTNWQYKPDAKQLMTFDSQCLHFSSFLVQSPTNIWAKPLKDGSKAAVFFNNGNVSATITCDVSCFQKMGFQSTDELKIRDLWKHQDVATITASQGYSAAGINPNGGSVLLKITKL